MQEAETIQLFYASCLLSIVYEVHIRVTIIWEEMFSIISEKFISPLALR